MYKSVNCVYLYMLFVAWIAWCLRVAMLCGVMFAFIDKKDIPTQ